MRIIDRHLVKGFTGSFIFSCAFFVLLFVIVDSFNNLNEFLREGVHFGLMVSYYVNLVPVAAAQIVPAGMLVSALYTLSGLNRNHEITALRVSGVSAFQILCPYLLISVVLSIGLFLFNETVVPESAVKSKIIMRGFDLNNKVNDRDKAQSFQNVTYHSANNRMLYAREYQVSNNTLYDVIILQDNPDYTVKSKLTAKKARFENNRWIFYNVIEYQMNAQGNLIKEPLFSETLPLDLDEKLGDFIVESSDLGLMNTKKILTAIGNSKDSNKKRVHELWLDLHHKIALCFATVFLLLVGGPIAIKIQRSNVIIGIGISFAIIALYYSLESIFLAISKGGRLPSYVGAWLANLLFALYGTYLIQKSK